MTEAPSTLERIEKVWTDMANNAWVDGYSSGVEQEAIRCRYITIAIGFMTFTAGFFIGRLAV